MSCLMCWEELVEKCDRERTWTERAKAQYTCIHVGQGGMGG